MRSPPAAPTRTWCCSTCGPKKLTGNIAEKALGRAHITCNKNGVPFDPEKPTVTSGVRLGSAAGTTRGFGTAEFREIGQLIVEVLDGLAAHGESRQRAHRGQGEGESHCACAPASRSTRRRRLQHGAIDQRHSQSISEGVAMSGFHGLFIPGPTNMPFAVRQAMDVPLEDQRSPDFPAFTLPLFRDLKKVFKTDKGQVFLFPSSGTGGWEAAITNTLSPGDKVLIAVFGQFSHLWADLCRRHGLIVDVIDVEWGEGVPLDVCEARLKADKSHEIKAVLVCHNETATGVTSDVAGVREALDAARHPALLMVDGVSSIASIDFRMDEWGVDLAVSGSQKGFMLPTGLGHRRRQPEGAGRAQDAPSARAASSTSPT